MSQPLPRLTWTRTQAIFTVTSTTAAILAAIQTELENAGCTVETLSPGGVLSALGVKLPGADVADLRIIIAGRSTAETPTMLTPDTTAADRLHIGIVKGITSETLTDWEAASPYSGGTFSGYWRHGGATTSMDALYILVSDEALMLSTRASSGSSPWLICHAGAVIDPHSENAASAESSGRVYGMSTMITTADANILSQALSGFWDHNTGANTATHCGAFLPGSSTWTTLRRCPVNAPRPSVIATSLQTPGAVESVCVPIYLEGYVSPFPVFGRLREVFFWHKAIHGANVNKTGPTLAGYTVSLATAASSEAVFFAAADNRA